MKKKYTSPRQKVVTIDTQERLLTDSNTGAGGYDGSSNPPEGSEDMDEDKPVKSEQLWDKW